MANIKIDSERCKGCCLCVAECPLGNIRMSEVFNKSGHHHAQIIDKDKCTGCALCCQMCPDVAIEIKGQPKKPKAQKRKGIKEVVKDQKSSATSCIGSKQGN